MVRVAGFCVWAAMVTMAVAPAEARSKIQIVGSSTVFPFTDAAVKAFGPRDDMEMRLESTGTGGGFARFCEGPGPDRPQLTGASRPIKASELAACRDNGVGDIIELKIGHDGIVIASAKVDRTFPFTRDALYKALAAQVVADGMLVANPYERWSQIASTLPERPIAVYGPPPSSGTRDSLETLALVAGCKMQPGYDKLSKEQQDSACAAMRHDPYYVDMTEDDEDTVRALVADRSGFGVFGYSFAFEHPDTISAHSVDGVTPDFDTIASGAYPLSRPLFLYVKSDAIDAVPGLLGFLNFYLSDELIAPGGTLAKIGLVPMTAEEKAESRERLARRLPVEGP